MALEPPFSPFFNSHCVPYLDSISFFHILPGTIAHLFDLEGVHSSAFVPPVSANAMVGHASLVLLSLDLSGFLEHTGFAIRRSPSYSTSRLIERRV